MNTIALRKVISSSLSSLELELANIMRQKRMHNALLLNQLSGGFVAVKLFTFQDEKIEVAEKVSSKPTEMRTIVKKNEDLLQLPVFVSNGVGVLDTWDEYLNSRVQSQR